MSNTIYYVIVEATIPDETRFGRYVAITHLPVFGIRPVLGYGETEGAARIHIESRAAEKGVTVEEITGRF